MSEETTSQEGQPALIFGKYKTMEDAEAAHKGLEKHFHDHRRQFEGEPEEEEKPVAEAEEPTAEEKPVEEQGAAIKQVTKDLESKGFNFADLAAEVQDNGSLSKETRAALNKAGYSDPVIDANIKAVQHESAQYNAALVGAAGGQESWDAISGWAQANLTDSELTEVNQILSSGSIAQAKFAIKGLVAEMNQSAGPSAPAPLVSGRASSGAVVPEGAPVINSRLDLAKAMSDPRYKLRTPEGESFRRYVDQGAKRVQSS